MSTQDAQRPLAMNERNPIARYTTGEILLEWIAYADGLESQLTALKQELAWRPIETAPRDGNSILGWRVGSVAAFECRFINEQWEFSDGCHMHGGPDGWLPLPQPPTPSKED